MSQTTANATGSTAWAAGLLSSFAEAGYARAEPPILQPAEPFLDLSGEAIRKISLEQDIEHLTVATGAGRNEYQGVLAALAGSDRKAALALVTDLMSIAGATAVGGRSVAEIADRFLEQSTLKGGGLPREKRESIRRFLAISGDPDDALAQLRTLATDARLNITEAIDQFESRIGFMAARGIDTAKVKFSTSFG